MTDDYLSRLNDMEISRIPKSQIRRWGAIRYYIDGQPHFHFFLDTDLKFWKCEE